MTANHAEHAAEPHPADYSGQDHAQERSVRNMAILVNVFCLQPLLLERLQPLPVAELAHDALLRQELRQLYQAWDFLQPLPVAAAQQLQQMLTRLGPRPLPDEQSAANLSASKHLCAALGQLGLAFTANIPLSGYWADAVLQP
ncbi:TPA: hypothetical protein ACH3X1_008661 [Trebouxia sp. C0004]